MKKIDFSLSTREEFISFVKNSSFDIEKIPEWKREVSSGSFPILKSNGSGKDTKNSK